MRGCLVGFIVGVAAAVAAWWLWSNHAVKPDWEVARDRIVSGAEAAEQSARTNLEALGLTPENIRQELDHTGTVIRHKTAAVQHALSNEAADARITAAIKAKLVADPHLSALAVSVSTTDGCVTLAGNANSVADIQKAMLLAYNTPGVSQVISTLQVR